VAVADAASFADAVLSPDTVYEVPTSNPVEFPGLFYFFIHCIHLFSRVPVVASRSHSDLEIR
jgi:hypothetical protein